MKEGQAHTSRIRRLLVVAGGVCLLAVAGAPTAAAELGLPGLTESELPVPAIADVPEVLDAPDEISETVALTPDIRAAEETTGQALEAEELTMAATDLVVIPVVESLPGIGTVTEPLLRHALPALDPVLETTTPVLDTLDGPGTTARIDRVPQDTQPVLGTTRTPSIAAAAIVEHLIVAPVPARELPAGLLGPTSTDQENLAASSRRAVVAPLQDSSPIAIPALPSVPLGPENTNTTLGGTKVSHAPPSAPAPFAPGGLPSGLASASASAGAGALVVLLAVLAAVLLPAAPGLGRRLRPPLAPWPRPILQVSLERPG